MRISLFSLMIIGLVTFSSCSKEEDENANIKQYYQGEWEFEGDSTSIDTTFIMNIDAEGNFGRVVVLDGISANLDGNVNNDGNVSGDISVGGTTLGSISGNLATSGTGSGNFKLFTDTYPWIATKQ